MAKLQLDVSKELEEQIQALFIKSAKEVLHELSKQEINSKDFLSYKEAALYIGVSFNTLKNFISDYGLKTISIGGKRFISKEEIVLFMKKYEK
ncbi:MAG: helix-turn-helix domain-containing protein [Tetragenococcus halophilus]|nr:helix-turn-helix domain-containing protein [Tetragenococcus halophilus]